MGPTTKSYFYPILKKNLEIRLEVSRSSPKVILEQTQRSKTNFPVKIPIQVCLPRMLTQDKYKEKFKG